MNSTLKPPLLQVFHPYRILVLPILHYESEAWTVRKQDITEITALRRTAGHCKWGHRSNEGILAKLRIKQMMEYIQNYHRKWNGNVNRINTGRCQPRGQKDQSDVQWRHGRKIRDSERSRGLLLDRKDTQRGT